MEENTSPAEVAQDGAKGPEWSDVLLNFEAVMASGIRDNSTAVTGLQQIVETLRLEVARQREILDTHTGTIGALTATQEAMSSSLASNTQLLSSRFSELAAEVRDTMSSTLCELQEHFTGTIDSAMRSITLMVNTVTDINRDVNVRIDNLLDDVHAAAQRAAAEFTKQWQSAVELETLLDRASAVCESVASVDEKYGDLAKAASHIVGQMPRLLKLQSVGSVVETLKDVAVAAVSLKGALKTEKPAFY